MPIIISGSNGISGVDGTAAAPAVQGADNNTGMFFPAADTIAFSEGGTESLRLNAAGNAVFTGTVQTAGITTPLYPLVQGTAVASTSGTAIDFTGIPSWVRRVTVFFNGVSTNGISNPIIQLGDSGGIETTGYTSVGTFLGSGVGSSTYTTGFGFNSGGATNVLSGYTIISLAGANTFMAVGSCAGSGGGAGFVYSTSGIKTLSDILDRIRITTVNGTDLFDAGSINLLWE